MNRPLQAEKQALRATVASRMGTLSPAQREAASRGVCSQLAALPEWRAALDRAGRARIRPEGWRENSGIMVYMPDHDEPDVQPLVREILRVAPIALPRVTDWSKRTMDAAWVGNLSVAPAGDLEVTRHGIRQPGPACPAVDFAQIDLCLIPGRAFDNLCNRLGRGGGFYDELLQRAVFAGPAGRAPIPHRPVLIGVCFDEQIVDRVPMDPIDVPLDLVVTPTSTSRRMNNSVA